MPLPFGQRVTHYLAAHATSSRYIASETDCGAAAQSRAYDRMGHPGTEADPPVVLVSPLPSVAWGVAAASLVTRTVART
jgi:hypothetical protein